ncbi:MATE family efflux transporter [Synergistaceae bacterium OttesenSCG-928-I11]|nr:MATE family efflux transporter [Synergistaceae bacterium OttesenSCG-928-I11]
MVHDNSSLMTEGPIWRHILIFSIPLIIGNLFQQMYNTVDTLVIGNFLGGNALASVGAGTTIIHLMLSLFAGLATGAGVVIAQFFGAGNEEGVGRAVQTSAAFTVAAGLCMTVVWILLSGPILRLIGTPEEVMRDARVYLQIYFGGMLPLLIYNMGAAVLRAVGDSRTPLYYLAVAMVANTVLDLVFVVWFGWGVEGVAVATLIAQTIAAWLVIRKLAAADGPYRLDVRAMRIEPAILLRILRVGVPAGLQQTLMGISNLVVQSFINAFGTSVMAAWNVFNKLDGVIILPCLSFGLAVTTFTGQNFGAGKRARIFEGMKTGLKMSVSLSIVVSFLFYVFADNLFVLFSKDPAVLEFGMRILRGMTPFYFIVAAMYVFSGVINGAGYSFATMIIMLFNLCIVRIAFLQLVSRITPEIDVVFLAYIVSWTMCSLGLFAYYKKGRWRRALETVVESE